MRERICIVGPIILISLLMSCSQPEPSQEVEDTVFETRTEWEERTVLPFPFAISLPKTAYVHEVTADTFRNKNWVGMKIESDVEAEHPITKMTKPDYFFFWWGYMSGYDSIEKFLNVFCGREHRKFDYEVIKSWNQNGLHFFHIQTKGCPANSVGTHQIILFIYKEKLFSIELPDGDWGAEAAQYFDVAIRSVRPVKE